MEAALWYALAAAAANLAGGLLITNTPARDPVHQRLLIGFGAGFMVAAALVGMVPHAVEGGRWAPLGILLGYLLVHFTQHVLTPHFHFGEETHADEMVGRWVGLTALGGLLLHTFFDGVAIAAAFLADRTLGLLVFLAILLHKIPEGVTVASIMLASGNSRRRALGAVALLGVTTLAGVLLTERVGFLSEHGLAVSAGVTIYVGASNLVPEVQKGHKKGAAASVALGAALFVLAYLMLGHVH